MVKNRRKYLKKEYIPIIITLLILIILIGALVFVITYKEKEKPEDYKFDYKKEEMIIDNKNSKCNTKQLNELHKLAEKIEFDSKPTKIKTDVGIAVDEEGTPDEELYGYVFDLTIKNVSDDLYIKITNDINDNEVILKKEQKVKDEYKFQTTFHEEIATYTMEVYSNKYDCTNEVMRKFTFKTPIYNSYSDNSELCLDPAYKDFYYCQRFIETNVPTVDQFYNEIRKYMKKQKYTTSKVTAPTDKKEANKKVKNKKEQIN